MSDEMPTANNINRNRNKRRDTRTTTRRRFCRNKPSVDTAQQEDDEVNKFNKKNKKTTKLTYRTGIFTFEFNLVFREWRFSVPLNKEKAGRK